LGVEVKNDRTGLETLITSDEGTKEFGGGLLYPLGLVFGELLEQV
jgi:hypothetical protein